VLIVCALRIGGGQDKAFRRAQEYLAKAEPGYRSFPINDCYVSKGLLHAAAKLVIASLTTMNLRCSTKVQTALAFLWAPCGALLIPGVIPVRREAR
jgi:hypothetical protein